MNSVVLLPRTTSKDGERFNSSKSSYWSSSLTLLLWSFSLFYYHRHHHSRHIVIIIVVVDVVFNTSPRNRFPATEHRPPANVMHREAGGYYQPYLSECSSLQAEKDETKKKKKKKKKREEEET